MSLPRINWTKVAESLAYSDPYAAAILAQASEPTPIAPATTAA